MTSRIDATIGGGTTYPPSFARAKVAHRPGALHLDGHPLLCCAPKHWGPGVRTEDNGTKVLDVARYVVAAGADAAGVAARFGCGEGHAAQAIDWAEQVGIFEALRGEG